MYYSNYSDIFRLPLHNKKQENGNQIFHFSTANKPIESNSSTLAYVNEHMHKAQIFESDAAILKFGIESALNREGFYFEFGVCSGRTINFIAALNPMRVIYGFDSFEGVPEDWKPEIPKGTFGLKQDIKLAPLLSNIRLEIGYFNETLPVFVNKHFKDSTMINFIHIECDIYSSTQTVLSHLGPYIKPGTIIHFDEYFNYQDWEKHEHKAFQELIAEYNLKYEYIAYNKMHEQVTVMIK
jgi:hypothetical protein